MKSTSTQLKVAEPAPRKQAEASRASSSGLTAKDLETMKAPFEGNSLGVKVQSFNRERTRALLVLYLQHTDVADRIEEVDPAWTFEVLGEERHDGTVYARGRLGIKGTFRENVGEGPDPKAAYSDALKRCAMLFGVGRYLYDSQLVWVDYDDTRDRWKQWSITDYEKASQKPAATKPTQAASVAPSVSARAPAPTRTPERAPARADDASEGSRPREELNRLLMNLYRPYLKRFPDTQFAEVLKSRYGVPETRMLSVEQLEDLVSHLERSLQAQVA